MDCLHVTPTETVMVGDSWPADIEGALGVGIRAIWFNPSGMRAPDPRTDVEQLRAFEPTDHVSSKILGAGSRQI